MKNSAKAITIVVADDDHDDCLLIKRAFRQNSLMNPVDFVHDGAELMDYLHRRGAYAEKKGEPLPGLILLDLNMPRKDGREVIAEIKSDVNLKRIPVSILTTSQAEADICLSYDLGANSYISKPVTFQGLVDAMKALNDYWLQIVSLPQRAE